MKVLPQQEEYLRNTIRDCMAVNPLVSVRKMQELVKKNTGRSISDKYLAKLMCKIRRQAIIQSDRKQMNERLSEVRERFRMLTDDLFRVVYWRPEFIKQYGLVCPTYKEKLAAIRLIAQLEIALFKTEVDTGAFESRQASVGGVLRQEVSQTGLQDKVFGVFREWKFMEIHEKTTDSPRVIESVSRIKPALFSTEEK